MPDIIVVGIGNPYRGDDAAGWAVVDLLAAKVDGSVHFTRQSGDIAQLMDIFGSYATVYLIDACSMGAPPGTWQRIDARQTPLDLDTPQTSTHGLSVSQAIALAKNLDQLPARLIIYAIAGKKFDMSDGLSPSVEKSVADVAQAILKEEDICLCTKKD